MTKTIRFIAISLSSSHRTVFNLFNCCAMLVIILIECSLLQPVVSGINHNEFLAQLKVPQCRQDCLDKFSSDDLACLQKLDCSICWNNCAPRSSSASVVQPNPVDPVAATKTSDEVIELSVRSIVHDGSLTMADVIWYADDPEQHQCLVTWEVFGGGIMDDKEENDDKRNTETQRPPFIQPHSNPMPATTERTTTTIRIQSTPSESSDNNHLPYDATKTIAGYSEDYQKYKLHEYNNHHEITAKHLHDAQKMSLHDELNRATETREQDGNDANLMHGFVATSPRDAAKISSKSSSSSSSSSSLPSAARIRHTDIETSLSVFCVVMVVVCLVICTIVSVRHRRKSNKHCDKSNLISSSSSVSCSSTTSINDCELDFNGSSACITQTTAIHV